MHPNRTMLAALVLLAAGCATAVPEDGLPGSINGEYEDAPPKLINGEQISRMMERELNALPIALQGKVRVWLMIDTEGLVQSIEIAESSGNAQLEAIARRVARRLRYRPARSDGKPVEARISWGVTVGDR